MDHAAVIDALGELGGRYVLAAVQFADRSLSPIALLRGRLRQDAAGGGRFDIGDGSIIVRSEDLLDAAWVEGLGEEPALRIDLHNVQITVSPGTRDMADPLA